VDGDVMRGRSGSGRPRTRDRRPGQTRQRRPGWWFWGPFVFGLAFTVGGVLFLFGSVWAGASPVGAASSGLLLTGVIWLVIGVGALAVAWYARRDIRSADEPARLSGIATPEEQRRIRATGVRGRATIRSFKYLGRHVDGATLVELGLEVNAGGPARDLVERALVPVPVARRLAVGATVPVTMALQDPDELDGTGLALDWTGFGLAGPA
jgi:hypothetical protein